MEAQLQCVKVEFIVLDDDNLAIENAARRQRRAQRLEQLGKVAVERLFVAALDQDLVSVAKDQRTKSVPLGLEDVVFAQWAIHPRAWQAWAGAAGSLEGSRLMVYRAVCSGIWAR